MDVAHNGRLIYQVMYQLRADRLVKGLDEAIAAPICDSMPGMCDCVSVYVYIQRAHAHSFGYLQLRAWY